MAIAFVRSAAASIQFGATSITVTLSATPANDNHVICTYTQTAGTAEARTWDTGFAEHATGDISSGVFLSDLYAAWKKAASEADAVYGIALGGSGDGNQCFAATEWSGGLTSASPIDVVSAAHNSSFGSPSVVPSITTTVDNCVDMVLTANYDNTTVTEPSGYAAAVVAAFDFERSTLMYKALGAAGATGTLSVTYSGGNQSDIRWAMKPAAAAGGGSPPFTSHQPQFQRQLLARGY